MSTNLTIDIWLAMLLAVCLVTDLTRGLIYNWVTLPAALLGLFLGWWYGGPAGLGWAVAGLLVGGGVLLAPFFMGMVGGGDVKLLAAVGALGGPMFGLKTTIYACLLGGAVALVIMLVHGKLLQGLKETGRFFWELMLTRSASAKPTSLGLPAIPFGVCIAGGAVWARFWDIL